MGCAHMILMKSASKKWRDDRFCIHHSCKDDDQCSDLYKPAEPSIDQCFCCSFLYGILECKVQYSFKATLPVYKYTFSFKVSSFRLFDKSRYLWKVERYKTKHLKMDKTAPKFDFDDILIQPAVQSTIHSRKIVSVNGWKNGMLHCLLRPWIR